LAHALIRVLRSVARPRPAHPVGHAHPAPVPILSAPRPRSAAPAEPGRHAELAPRSAVATRLTPTTTEARPSGLVPPAPEGRLAARASTATAVAPARLAPTAVAPTAISADLDSGEQLTFTAVLAETGTPAQLGPIRPIDLSVVARARAARASQARPVRSSRSFDPRALAAWLRPLAATLIRLSAARPTTRFLDLPILARAALGVRGVNRERLVPVGVAALVLVASIVSVGPAAGVRGATGNVGAVGAGPRIAIGGEAAAVGGTDGPGPLDPAATSFSRALAAEPEADAAPSGPFALDGTLLKPVAVDTSVPDGAAQLRSYRVRSGDTLVSIAARFRVSMMTLWWANEITSKTDLHIGQTLVIPPVTGTVVTVGAGDTLGSIAAASGVDEAVIMAYNGLADATLVLGQVLIVPGGQGDAIAAPAPTPTHRPAARAVSRPAAPAPSRYTGGRLAWPVPGGYISQYFHPGHEAIDIAAPYGSRIVAAAAGTVTFAGWKNNGGGYQVWISHGSNLYTTYNHMSSISVGAGQRVGRGQFVGRVGMTGDATGPHCHFEVWIGPIWNGGTRVNPLAYL
jgi:murein DD-endopeptidase MepM/ murein hydrolase activator NlpD